mgnify:CR=1 FL=1
MTDFAKIDKYEILERIGQGEEPGDAGRAALDYPQPRLALGRALRGLATSCIDVSDDLLADLGHILDQSSVGAELQVDALPVYPELGGLDAAHRWSLQLGGGDDYELCFTVPAGAQTRLPELAEIEPLLRAFTAANKDSDSERKGFELFLNSRPLDGVLVTASYTYTDATEDDAEGVAVREVRRPRHMASVNVDWRFAQDRAGLNLNVNYTGKQFDRFFDPATFVQEVVRLDAYTVADLAASWKLTDALELVAILEQDYGIRISDRSEERFSRNAETGCISRMPSSA